MISTIGLVVDIVIVAMLVIWGIIGLKKGFFKSLLSLFSWSACIIIAFTTAKYVAGWIDGIYNFSNLFGTKITVSLTKMNEFFSQPINTFSEGGKDALIAAINDIEINGMLKQVVKVVFSNGKIDMTSSSSIGSVVGSSLGRVCMVVISGILVFVVLKIAVALLSKFFNNLEQIKLIGGMNKLIGMLIGLAKACIIIITINCILVTISLVPAVNKKLTPFIENNTYIERFIYKQTDKLYGKYLIEGDVLSKLTKSLWSSR